MQKNGGPAAFGERKRHHDIVATVLVVDDDEEVSTFLRLLCENERMIALCAKNGREATQLFENFTFDIIITEIVLPEMDGIELIRFLRAHCPDCKMLAYSASQHADVYLRAAAALKAECISCSPFNVPALQKRIRTLAKNPLGQSSGSSAFAVSSRVQGLLDGLSQRMEELHGLFDIAYQITPSGKLVYVGPDCTKLGFEQADLIGSHYSCLIDTRSCDDCRRETALKKHRGTSNTLVRSPKLIDENRTAGRITKGLYVHLKSKFSASDEEDDSTLKECRAILSASGYWDRDIRMSDKKFLGTVGIIRLIYDNVHR
ncbi:MAG: response regulator [Chitinivibrionales bacterium]|nr:response regulator [Chitinivibrionales bacterium]